MANTMWLPCNWKVVLDNFNESYHVPTVHMRATPDTDRKKIRGNIDTYFKETKFDLSEEGHNRMVMKGGYGVGSTDEDGNIIDPLATQLKYWEINPEDFKGRPEDTERHYKKPKESLVLTEDILTTIGFLMSNSRMLFITHYFLILRCLFGPTDFTFCVPGLIAAIQSNVFLTTGGTRVQPL